MIREARSTDIADIIAIAKNTEMFGVEDLGMFTQFLQSAFDEDSDHQAKWLVDDDGGVCAAACHTPEMMGQGVHNILFIGVLSSKRTQGRAKSLLKWIERALSTQGARMVLIETSSLEQFIPARTLYDRSGYLIEAQIRDFYNPAEDKIVFKKVL